MQINVFSMVFVISFFLGCVEGKFESETFNPDLNPTSTDLADSDKGGDTETDTNIDTGMDPSSDIDTVVDSDTYQDPEFDTDSDSDSDTVIYDDTFTEEEVCGKEDFPINAVPARVMLLQDISGSMNDSAGGGSSKWVQAKQALTKMLNNFGNELEIGFDAFPRNGSCGPGARVIIDSELNSASKIFSEFPRIAPNGSTPLLAAMKKFLTPANAPRFLSKDATSYLIIVSDGDDTCAGGFFQMGATAAQLSTTTSNLLIQRDVRTYVIGFGDGASPAKLNAIAAAGGTGAKRFINAMDTQELTDALNQIGSSVVSCVYDLGEKTDANVDLDKANFYFDENVIGRDDGCANGAGWQWANGEKTRVEFCREACAQLQTGEVKNISVTFGCTTIIMS